MKDKPAQKKSGNELTGSPKKNTINRILIFAGVLLAILAAYMFWPSAETITTENKVAPQPAATSIETDIDPNKLAGKWQRTDGGYILELLNPTKAGLIEASYFNPNPIHVGSAAWQKKEGNIQVIVELQDKNYPGSIYTLTYDANEDQLRGTYFQAVERVNYDVVFSRVK